MTERYARQVAVVGASGHRAITDASATVIGEGLAAEVCARYLAGAGVGLLRVHHRLLGPMAAANSMITIEGHDLTGDLVVSLADDSHQPGPASPVARGAAAARWALAKILSGAPR